MNILFWIIQILLAAVFMTSGTMKTVLHKDKLAKALEWVDDFTPERLKIIGAFEILGGLGLSLPGVYSIAEFLIPLAATGLAIIMVLAALTHFNRGEKVEIIINIVLFILNASVAIFRFSF